MNNIIYDDEIITPEDNINIYYEKFIKKLNVKDCVKFTLFCAKIVNHNSKESNHCIKLVEKWLLDGKSVTREELYFAASAAYHVFNTAPYASNHFNPSHAASDVAAFAAYSAFYTTTYTTVNATNSVWYTIYVSNASSAAVNAHIATAAINNHITNDLNLYLKTLLRITKQYNTKIHNNQHYESILKEIIKEDIDKLTDADYNMLIDLSQEYYNINPNITNKRIFVELLRKEYE